MKNTTERTSTLPSLIFQSPLPPRRTAYVMLAAVVLATSGLVLGTPAPTLAHHRDVGDGECSWFPDKGLFHNFHEACTNHDACGEKAGSDQRKWDRCDDRLRVDAKNWCIKRWAHWNTVKLGSCLTTAESMYWGLRAFVNGTRIHRY